MKTKIFTEQRAANKFADAMQRKGYGVSPVMQRGCIARGVTYKVQFSNGPQK